MDAPMKAVLVVAGVLCAANLTVSYLVIRSPFYSRGQKAAQCVIVWSLPILGPIGVWAFLRSQFGWAKYDTRAYREPSEKMIAVEVDDAISSGHSHGTETDGHGWVG